jgi:hypothetical protein
MKYLKDKILPGLIVLLVSAGLTWIEKMNTTQKQETNKTTDDRQDECIQDRVDHDRIQDSAILLIQNQISIKQVKN